ncbi:hypothetical protein [Dictyobacter formicarum]|uniref:DUF4878 domain-containing protein n=1 Tax=Dictyobacter formicarum TaxID=2778368 RepID=A0ABQ3VTF4_9CHLR|nr:hypothetical protein [Dictyobacter formicarum]GHO89085.1 hypothetical protein KSZ_70910 [Dictyobacter formicarum]
MQGRENQESGSFEKPSTQGLPSLNGTSKQRAVLRNPNEGTSKHQAIQQVISQKTTEQRAIPKRPAGMARVDTPPEMTRVPRPTHQEPPPQKLRKRILMFGGVFLVLAIVAGVVGYLLASGMFASAPASTTATDFLSALNSKNYAQAYKDLGPAITIRISQDQFIKQAQVLDTCYGPVQDYNEVENSAQVQDNSQIYFYTIKRTKDNTTVPYKLQITLQQDQDDGSWKVTDYSNNMGPGQPVPACSK